MKKQDARDKAYDSLGMRTGKESMKKISYPARLDDAEKAKKGHHSAKPGTGDKANEHYMKKAEEYNKKHHVGKDMKKKEHEPKKEHKKEAHKEHHKKEAMKPMKKKAKY